MDLFDEAVLNKLDKEEEKTRVFNSSNQKLRVISTANRDTSLEYLLRIKLLFQKMLPKMPREYILRQVFDPKHCCLALTDSDSLQPGSSDELVKGNIIGAVCYQPAFNRNIVEIIFLAVNSEFHISGYGTFLFSCLKEICKMQLSEYLRMGDAFISNNKVLTDLSLFIAEDNPPVYFTREYTSDKNLYLMTYADNSAIGFFKKQGFTLRPVSNTWKGYIKDYEGGTLMECKVLRDIQYLKKKALVKSLRDKIFKKMEEVNEYHILRAPNEKEGLAPILEKHRESMPKRTREDFLRDFIFFLLCSLQSDPSSWPFLEPVSTVDVPDYATVIRNPMDLGTMYQKHKNGHYNSLQAFSDDLYLMVDNCYLYNTQGTQYYKCAENIQLAYEKLLRRYEQPIKKWGYAHQ